MMQVKLQWATPNIDAQIAYQARVSNPDNQSNENISGLFNYCIHERISSTSGLDDNK